MKLKNSINKVFFLAFFFFNQISNLNADNHVIDIWKKVDNKEKNLTENNSSVTEKSQPTTETSGLFEAALNKQGEQNIINSNLITDNEKKEVYGLYDPETNNFTLQMWSNTDGNSIKEMFKKINQKDLSDFSEKIFLETILTHSYLPYDSMTEEEFLNLKLGWLINHNKIEILEQFLNKNKEFPGKEKVIRYLVDESLSEANLKRSCEKVAFLSNSVKDFYLDKFRVYCLISENKLSEAQVTFDLLNEQYAKADKNFNEKISFALGLTETKNDKIYDDNMLNFFISSKISEKFNYKPTNKTDPYIWKYMNNAGLIQVDNIEDLTEIEKIEIAAAEEKISDDKVFEIYKKINFNFNEILNADILHQNLEPIKSRALIFQKYLLSETTNSKLQYLFLLREKFRRADLSNVYNEFLSQELKDLKATSEIPSEYSQLVELNIIKDQDVIEKKIKFNDKNYYSSKLLEYFDQNNQDTKKFQKLLNTTVKKISKNKKYQLSTKDIILLESFKSEGFLIPKEINYTDQLSQFKFEDEMIKLSKSTHTGLLALKLVDLFSQDNVKEIDDQNLLYITVLLNNAGLKNIRNQILMSTLPERI